MRQIKKGLEKSTPKKVNPPPHQKKTKKTPSSFSTRRGGGKVTAPPQIPRLPPPRNREPPRFGKRSPRAGKREEVLLLYLGWAGGPAGSPPGAFGGAFRLQRRVLRGFGPGKLMFSPPSRPLGGFGASAPPPSWKPEGAPPVASPEGGVRAPARIWGGDPPLVRVIVWGLGGKGEGGKNPHPVLGNPLGRRGKGPL